MEQERAISRIFCMPKAITAPRTELMACHLPNSGELAMCKHCAASELSLADQVDHPLRVDVVQWLLQVADQWLQDRRDTRHRFHLLDMFREFLRSNRHSLVQRQLFHRQTSAVCFIEIDGRAAIERRNCLLLDSCPQFGSSRAIWTFFRENHICGCLYLRFDRSAEMIPRPSDRALRCLRDG